jgi:hypothetical protein
MQCTNHNDRGAIAVCVNCGVGLCPSCATKSTTGRRVCSAECAASADAFHGAIAATATRSVRTNKATAWLAWLLGGFFGVLGVISIAGGDHFLSAYFLGSAAVFLFIGTWYARIARRAPNTDVQPTPVSGRS